jgi:hypothetical protein
VVGIFTQITQNNCDLYEKRCVLAVKEIIKEARKKRDEEVKNR